MLEIVSVWLVLFISVSGLGFWLLPRNWIEEECVPWLLLFVTGYVALIGVLQIWHIFFPVNLFLFYTISLIGIGGWIYRKKWILTKLNSLRWYDYGLLLIGAIWLSNRALSPQLTFDTGLYHLQMVNWLKEYSLVPGLGNLKGSLAFNNSSLLYAAWVDQGPWAQSTVRLSTGLVILVFLSTSLRSVTTSIFSKSSPTTLFFGLILMPILFCAVYSIGLSTDIPIILLGVFVTERFFRLLFFTTQYSALLWVPLVICGITCVTIKLSSLIFIGTLLVVSIISVFIKKQESFAVILRLFFLGVLLWGTPWVIRGYISSGYPAFPSSFGGLNVDWRVPDYVLESKRVGIYTFAKNPTINRDQVKDNWGWVNFWIPNILLKDKGLWLVVFPAVGVIPFLLLLIGNKLYGWIGMFLIPSIVGTAFWFFMAPAPRFLGVTIWYLFVGLLVLFILRKSVAKAPFKKAFLSANLLSCIFLLGVVAWLKPKSIWTEPGPASGLWPLPQPVFEEIVTNHGLVILRPTAGGAEMAQVWNMPLVSAFHVDLDLRLRNSDSMADGFLITNKSE